MKKGLNWVGESSSLVGYFLYCESLVFSGTVCRVSCDGTFPFEINNHSNYVALILNQIHYFLCTDLMNLIQDNFSFFLGAHFTENYS